MNIRNSPDVCRDCLRRELCLDPSYCEYADGMPTKEEMDEEACLDAEESLSEIGKRRAQRWPRVPLVIRKEVPDAS